MNFEHVLCWFSSTNKFRIPQCFTVDIILKGGYPLDVYRAIGYPMAIATSNAIAISRAKIRHNY